ncbi:glutamate--cysteine ligase [Alteromonas facilis]|uniref:glutamate--cysteine ligase n=1 Tax=Alteromonas facilis TaxID=2048004 RepID=UPI000C29598F|nr:glutamate--cysteine ligase [Alteromonas facilis]
MPNKTLSLSEAVAALSQPQRVESLLGIKHGVEREALRITPQGGLSQASHPRALGSALTHDCITTDFSEALLEFITPPESDPQTTLDQLSDIHKFTVAAMDDEALWPMSMPCYIDSEEQIPIAQYGTSNVGRMKSTYRIGLKNRYGAMMQAISGIHFNFSLPESFWQQYATLTGETYSSDFVSQQYFDLIRNYRRWCWLIPFLYGASPAICSSFLKGKKHNLEFKKLGRGTLYLPYATSLRMSDLGYTNSQQSALDVCYNNLHDYVCSVRRAIGTHSSEYERFSAGENGEYQQLNRNILQIENELYSPIRPKQVARSLEKPTDALEARGVSYVEVRALDVDPMSAEGISLQQFYFLDVFLLTCVLTDSPAFTRETYTETERNLKRVVTHGRDPSLTLHRRDENGESVEIGLKEWASDLFEAFKQVAKLLDSAYQTTHYSDAVNNENQKVLNPDLTPSAKILSHLLASDIDNGRWGLALAEQYKQEFMTREYRHFDESYFVDASHQSRLAQESVEAADDKPFDVFLAEYFSR